MAIIMEIRERFGVIVVFVIALAIIGFLFMDSLNSDTSRLRGNSNYVGIVNGQKVDYLDLEREIQKAEDNYKRSTGKTQINDQTRWAIRDQTWTQHINDLLMGQQYEELGIQVTTSEFSNMIKGPNPSPYAQQFFASRLGQYDPAQIPAYLQKVEEDVDLAKDWQGFKDFLRKNKKESKYANLVRKGLYVPGWQAKTTQEITSTSVDFDYVYLPYADIGNDEVSVSQEDLETYYDNHQFKYKQEESRIIEYVSFDIVPTHADTLKTKERVNALVDEFKKSDKIGVFVKLYSDEPFDPKYYEKDSLDSPVADTFFVVDTNTVIGPYFQDSAYVIAKLIDRKLIPDSVRARHIFLDVSGAKTQEDVIYKRQQADSILTKLKNGADFEQLVLEYSDDDATSFKGGDLGWIKPGEMFRTINDSLFYYKEEGDIFVAGSDDPKMTGFHIIEITESNPTKEAVQVAFVLQKIFPSDETTSTVYSEATKFAGTHGTSEEFKAAEDQYTIHTAEGIKKSDNEIFGLGPAREVVRWAYKAKPGQISEVFETTDEYIVARLAKIKEKGTIPLDEVKAEVEVAVKQQKKAEMLKEKINNAGASTVDAAASALGVEVKTATGLNFNNAFIPDVGLEPEVVSQALTLEKGKTLGPVAGENGVFLIEITSKSAPPATEDYTAFQKGAIARLSGSVSPQMLKETIKETAEIEDDRYKFY